MNKPLTTAEVPPQFLKAALLVGHIPLKALAFDPRISYALYVPPEHYDPNPQRSENGDHGSTSGKLPLLVFVHGTGRDISSIRRELASFADSIPCAVLAPLFPAGVDGYNGIEAYKLLRSDDQRFDLALLSMLDEIAKCWLGIDTDKVFLMGWSGGAQFAHRFLYLHPERLAAASIGAPGRVTFLDEQQKWPLGVADVESIFGKSVERDLIKQVRIQLVVGGADINVHGGKEFWAWVQQLTDQHKSADQDGGGGQAALPPMEQGRRDTLKQFQAMLKEQGIESQLDVVDGVAHAVGGVRECMLAFLGPRMQKWYLDAN